MKRSAFTLFEVILALALSATLLALIGTAINLYLVRMDNGRTRVEEAQLARSILSTIAADVRATTVYQTQDISTVQQLASSAVPFDPDSLDAAGEFDASALGDAGGAAAGALGGAGGTAGAGAAGESASGGTSMGGTQTTTTTMAPGLNGLIKELMLDVARLPRLNELFPAMPQQASSLTAASAAANQPRPSDLKSVRYFLRQGTAIDPSDAAASALSPQSQAVGGLVRQTIDRAIRDVAEQSANSQLLNSGQVLLAPEVTDVQFIYFDGTTAVDQWDMQQMGSLPTAVDVRIWIAPDPIDAAASEIPLQPRMYSQTVELPLAQAAGGSAAGGQPATDDATTDDSMDAAGDDQGLGGTGGTGSGI
jgi:hypothetical protein